MGLARLILGKPKGSSAPSIPTMENVQHRPTSKLTDRDRDRGRDSEVGRSYRPASSVATTTSRRHGSSSGSSSPRSGFSTPQSTSSWTCSSRRSHPHSSYSTMSEFTSCADTASQYSSSDDDSATWAFHHYPPAASQYTANNSSHSSASLYCAADRTSIKLLPVTAPVDESHLTFQERIRAANERRILRARQERELGISDYMSRMRHLGSPEGHGIGAPARAPEPLPEAQGQDEDYTDEQSDGEYFESTADSFESSVDSDSESSVVTVVVPVVRAQPQPHKLSTKTREVIARAVGRRHQEMINEPAVNMRPQLVPETMGKAPVTNPPRAFDRGVGGHKHRKIAAEPQTLHARIHQADHHHKPVSKSRHRHSMSTQYRHSPGVPGSSRVATYEANGIARPATQRSRRAEDRPTASTVLHKRQTETTHHRRNKRHNQGYHESESESRPISRAEQKTTTSHRHEAVPFVRRKGTEHRPDPHEGRNSKARPQPGAARNWPALTQSLMHKLSRQQLSELVDSVVKSPHSRHGKCEADFANRHALQLMSFRHMHWWFRELEIPPRNVHMHKPWANNLIDIADQPSLDSAHVDASIRALSEIEFAESLGGVEHFLYPSQSAIEMFDFQVPSKSTDPPTSDGHDARTEQSSAPPNRSHGYLAKTSDSGSSSRRHDKDCPTPAPRVRAKDTKLSASKPSRPARASVESMQMSVTRIRSPSRSSPSRLSFRQSSAGHKNQTPASCGSEPHRDDHVPLLPSLQFCAMEGEDISTYPSTEWALTLQKRLGKKKGASSSSHDTSRGASRGWPLADTQGDRSSRPRKKKDKEP